MDPEDDPAPLRVTLFRNARHREAEIMASPDDSSLEICRGFAHSTASSAR